MDASSALLLQDDGRHPPKELCCPITQELLRDPVVAEDGHTYERSAILRWFASASAARSPVTNEELPPTRRLVPNHALRRILDQHRSSLGVRLLAACASLPHAMFPPTTAAATATPSLAEPDEVEVMDLVERGASLTERDPVDGSTCLHILVARGRFGLVRKLVASGADASVANDRGETPSMAAKRRRGDEDLVRFLDDAAARARTRRAQEEEARLRDRDEHRRQQADLRRVSEARQVASLRAQASSMTVPLVAGTGFFPSLFGLQFHGSLEPVRAHVDAARSDAHQQHALLRAADWARTAIVGHDMVVVSEDARQVQLLSRVLLGLGSSVLLFLLLL